MGLFKELFGSKKLAENELVEAGACPNCWGKQKYDGKFVEFVDDQTKSNIGNDKQKRKAFIAQFVETYVTGIRLKKDGDLMKCPTCNSEYKNIPFKTI